MGAVNPNVHVLYVLEAAKSLPAPPTSHGFRLGLIGIRLAEEIGDLATEGVSHLLQDIDAGIYRAALKPPDVAAINVCIDCQRLLREARRDAQTS